MLFNYIKALRDHGHVYVLDSPGYALNRDDARSTQISLYTASSPSKARHSITGSLGSGRRRAAAQWQASPCLPSPVGTCTLCPRPSPACHFTVFSVRYREYVNQVQVGYVV